MVELMTILAGKGPHPDDESAWASFPWPRAFPALHWLGLKAKNDWRELGPAVPDAEVRAICDAMVRRMVCADGSLAWSSFMLETAVTSVGHAVVGPPEAFLRSVWDDVAGRELDEIVYEFCRALGAQVRTRYGVGSKWDLGWMKRSAQASQYCLLYWVLAVKPEVWDELEPDAMALLQGYPFPF